MKNMEIPQDKSPIVNKTNNSPSFLHPEIKSSKALSLLGHGSSKNDSSKIFSFDSTMMCSEDTKNTLAKNFKDAIKKKPMTIYTNKTGVFEGFVGYSFKNNKKINEDKLEININYVKGNSNLISLYSIYDGHGGEYVADYVKENLQKELVNNDELLKDYKKAILSTYEKIEKSLLESTGDIHNKQSGSCALLLMTMNNKIVIANIGDSRGIISINNGKKIYSLSVDHKPNNDTEKQRIRAFGGLIKIVSKIHRLFPGGLSVSRAFGDSENKLPQLGGKPNVLIAVPDIFSFDYMPEMDFILLGCDGIYESFKNKDIVLIIYTTLKRSIEKKFNYNDLLERIVYKIKKKIIQSGTKDNLTCVFLPFIGFKLLYDNQNIQAIDETISGIKGMQSTGEKLYENITDSFIYKIEPENILPFTSGLDFKKKSTILNHNIRLYEGSFSKSDISIEAKGNPNKKISIEEYETSDENRKETKPKQAKRQMNCCGLFTFG